MYHSSVLCIAFAFIKPLLVFVQYGAHFYRNHCPPGCAVFSFCMFIPGRFFCVKSGRANEAPMDVLAGSVVLLRSVHDLECSPAYHLSLPNMFLLIWLVIHISRCSTLVMLYISTEFELYRILWLFFATKNIGIPWYTLGKRGVEPYHNLLGKILMWSHRVPT